MSAKDWVVLVEVLAADGQPLETFQVGVVACVPQMAARAAVKKLCDEGQQFDRTGKIWVFDKLPSYAE